METGPAEGVERGQAVLSWTWLTCLVVGCVGGAAIAFLLLFLMFADLPSDMQRKSMLVRSLMGTGTPSRVVFGSSVAMNAVDGRALDKLLGEGLTYSISSTAQTLAETRLLYDLLPRSVTELVVFVHPLELEKGPSLNKPVADVFAMSGYELNPETGRALRPLVRAHELEPLEQNLAWSAFDSRWALRQALDTTVRGVLRKDLDLAKAATDLQYPAPYTRRVRPKAFARSLDNWSSGREHECFRVAPRTQRLIDELSARVQRDGRTATFVLAPVHPELIRRFGSCFLVELNRFLDADKKRTGRGWLSLAELVPDQGFIDAVHLGSSGAQRVVKRLARELDGS